MSERSEVAMKGIKELDREVSAWQMRLESVKSDVTGLKTQKEALEKQIEQIRAVAEKEFSDKMLKARQELSRIEEDRTRFEETKKLFEGEVLALRQERNAFEREKTDTLAMKAEMQAIREKVQKFILVVRRESEGL